MQNGASKIRLLTMEGVKQGPGFRQLRPHNLVPSESDYDEVDSEEIVARTLISKNSQYLQDDVPSSTSTDSGLLLGGSCKFQKNYIVIHVLKAMW
jgi:hypothetical protein